MVGAFGGIYLAGMSLNIFSFIGLIMLMGLVTKTAILLVDFANGECLDAELPFGVVLIRSGQEVGGGAEPFDTGCTARIKTA